MPSIAEGWAAAAVGDAMEPIAGAVSLRRRGSAQLVSRVARGETEPPDVSVHRQPGWLCLEPGIGSCAEWQRRRKGRAREVWAKCLGSRRVLWAAKAQRTNTHAGSETRAERCNGRAAQCTRVGASLRCGVCIFASESCIFDRVSSVCIFGVSSRVSSFFGVARIWRFGEPCMSVTCETSARLVR